MRELNLKDKIFLYFGKDCMEKGQKALCEWCWNEHTDKCKGCLFDRFNYELDKATEMVAKHEKEEEIE